MRASFFSVVFVLFATVAAAQTSPCATTQKGDPLNPNKIYVQLDEFNTLEFDGTQRVSDVQFAMFAEGSNPNTSQPVQGPSTMPRSAFAAVAGFTGCYLADIPMTIPTGQRLVASFQPRRTSPPGIAPWGPVSDFFGAVPTVLAAAGRPVPRRQ